MIIATIFKRLFGKVLSSAVIVDNGDRAVCANIIVIFCDVILGIGDINMNLAQVMAVDLFIIGDDLASFFGVSGDVGSPPEAEQFDF